MEFIDDPIGAAIWDFHLNQTAENIIVASDLCDNDIIPTAYLFRTFEEMPIIEQKAIELSRGKCLDVGAASGCHSIELAKKGLDVTALDHSKGACEYLSKEGFKTIHSDIFTYHEEKYDTILMLMNGLGIAGTLNGLGPLLQHLSTLLSDGGQLLADSADISYLFEDDEGGMWVDLNANYYGEMKFNMSYKEISSGWFDWVYIDAESIVKTAAQTGLNAKIVQEGESNNYLFKFTKA